MIHFGEGRDGCSCTVRLIDLEDMAQRAGLSEREWALFEASREGDEELVRRLLGEEEGISGARNALGETALHVAGGTGQVVPLLVQSGGGLSPTLLDLTGYSPLHRAAEGGSLNVLKALLEALPPNVSVDLAPGGPSPLLLAAQCGSVPHCRLLLAAGADPDYSNDVGLTPFLAACKAGHVPVVELMLELGQVDLSHCDSRGRNALHLAIISGHAPMCKLLLSVDLELAAEQDHARKTPMDYISSLEVRRVVEQVHEEESKRKRNEQQKLDEDECKVVETANDPVPVGKLENEEPDVVIETVEKSRRDLSLISVVMFQDEVLDFAGTVTGDIETQVAEYFSSSGPGSSATFVSQSLSCVYIPSPDPKHPGRIKRILSVFVKR